MHRKRYRGIILVAVALISVSCIGQQAQQTTRNSAPKPSDRMAASQQAVPAAVAPPSISIAANSSAPLMPETSLSGTSAGGPPSQPSTDPDRSTTIDLRPALRGILSSKPEPPRRRPVLWSLFGQQADLGIFAVGNFNPSTYISIQNTPHTVISSNKSSMGGGVEYQRWFSGRYGFGFLYVQNPSDGKLLWQGQDYIWPQMRRDFSILAAQRFEIGRFASFLNEGPGVVVTNGYSNCGWSAGLAFVAGLGTDYQVSRRFSARTGITFLDTKGGCYDDQTCHATWGVAEDLRVGLVYKWSGENRSYLLR